MEAQFEELREKLPSMTAEQCITDIVWRVYTELCCSTAGRNIRSSQPHAKNALQQWIDCEVHYALEGKDVNDALHTEVREAILKGVVTRAVDLFSDWNGRTSPAHDANDDRNLRSSLRTYLPEHLQ